MREVVFMPRIIPWVKQSAPPLFWFCGTGPWQVTKAPSPLRSAGALHKISVRSQGLLHSRAGARFSHCLPLPGSLIYSGVSRPYQEILNGVPLVRMAPGVRHEAICARLYRAVLVSAATLKSTRVLEPRSEVRLSKDTVVRPDLALVAAATGKLWLAAEIIHSGDHAPDTVVKKQIYEDVKVPRLWMIDPRYDNVELYHASPYGLTLQGILAGSELVTEKLLPEFRLTVKELFEMPDARPGKEGFGQ